MSHVYNILIPQRHQFLANYSFREIPKITPKGLPIKFVAFIPRTQCKDKKIAKNVWEKTILRPKCQISRCAVKL